MNKTGANILAAIPCYNTENYIADVIAKTKQYVNEIIIIDDGSIDKTAEIASSLGATVVRHLHNKGYGAAIQSCFKTAKKEQADILITLDGDGQHDPSNIPTLLAPVLKGETDLVIGSRFMHSNMIPKYRQFGIKIINNLWNFGSKIKLSDTQSGFRVYSKKLLDSLTLTEDGMSISIEILEKSRREKINIIEVPISCSYHINQTFNVKAFSHGFTVALSVIKIRMS